MIAAALLAAGRSSRMGRSKALIHLQGRAIVDVLADTYRAAGLDRLVVVASGEVLSHLLERDDLELVRGDPAQPMIDSVARALEVLESADALVVQPVDAPFTTVPMLEALTDGREDLCRVLCHQGRAGHPVLVPRASFSRIAERPRGGLRAVLAEHEVELVEWPDARILADLDTPEDLARWTDLVRLH